MSKAETESFEHFLCNSYSISLSDYFEALAAESSGIESLYSHIARLFSSVLNLSEISSGFAIFWYNNDDVGSLNVPYSEPGDISSDEFEAISKSLTGFLTDNFINAPVTLTREDINSYAGGELAVPASAVVIPICSESASYGFAAALYYDDAACHAADSPQTGFLFKTMRLASLYCYCELSKTTFSRFLMNDSLTDLPNRTHIYESIVYSLQTAEIYNTKLAILIVRINGLKNINNSLGIVTGDIILKEMGALIKSAASSEDLALSVLVGRLSGGDFVVLVTLPADNETESADETIVRTYCSAIIEKTGEHLEISGYKLYLSTNIGVSIYPYHGETADELLRKADLAKSASRENGPNTYKFYKNLMEGDAERTLFLNSNLPTALSSNQFELFYQAVMNVKTDEIVGAEALIRWRHPEKGLIFPGDFIPFSDDNGYSIQIDKLVLEMACRQINSWQDKGLNLIISVNISPRHFENGHICDSVSDILEKTSIDPSRLRIELLESILLEDFDVAVKVIGNLRSLGVNVALDDFGSGYSSLEYVARLPIDFLKIDRSFSMRMDNVPTNKVILETIMTLAKGLHVKTVAEGVESKSHLDFLKSIGCDFAQGYFISKPIPANEFELFLGTF